MDAQGRRHVPLRRPLLILSLIISAFCTNSSLIPFRRPLLILSLIISAFCTNSSLISANSSDKVTLELFYETLCPYCSNLIVNYLYKIFDTGLIEITNLKLNPYGNAKIGPNSTIVCQVVPKLIIPFVIMLNFFGIISSLKVKM